ncbi:hypothetical protein AWB67_00118 [Caballeronia terrestris]|uniref:Uncharacterized protein n=1 Tax=Caballeronia terrestris TaxID=1226301 RepID=A0A158EVQ6_9BURK|nr:hypothetical protein [Caballeronia terrestris]SAL11636.1 hypothetical protein AWB67_00118 [Caballeronia terrestris]
MAARASRKSIGLFSLAERQVLGLYDAGMLSPAVLHHVIAAYVGRDVDWNEDAKARSVDDRSLHEVVVLTMMPGRALRNAKKDFLSVIEHWMGEQPSVEAEEPEQDDDLLTQLSGASKKPQTQARKEPARKSAAFNPLVKARPLR